MNDALKKHVHPVDVHVGRKLKQKRLISGWSQKTLGYKVQLTEQQIHKYEKGANRVGASRLYEFCKIFNVSPNYFYEGYQANKCKHNVTATSQTSNEDKNELGLYFGAINYIESEKEIIRLISSFQRIPDREVRNCLCELANILCNKTGVAST